MLNKEKIGGLKEKLFLLLIASGIAVFVGQAFEESFGRLMPEYGISRSIVNRKESGLSALFAITRQSGIPCQSWLLPYNQLPKTKGLLYIVAPEKAFTEAEAKAILAWVKKGNQLIYFAPFCHYAPIRKSGYNRVIRVIDQDILVSKLGILAEVIGNVDPNKFNDIDLAGEDETDKHNIVYYRQQPEMSHVKKLEIAPISKLIGGNPIVGCNRGAYVTEVKHGSGSVLLGTVPGVCANSRLKDKSNYDNFQFMINCFRTANGAILFDERCHGLRVPGNMLVYLSNRAPGLICAQGLLILILAVISTRLRFGSFITLRPIRKISDLAYVSGLANVYNRAQANLAALEIIVGVWKTKLCRWLAVSPRASNDEIMLRAKHVNDTVEQNIDSTSAKWLSKLKDFLADYEQVIGRSQTSKAQLIYLVQQCDSLERDMSDLKRSRGATGEPVGASGQLVGADFVPPVGVKNRGNPDR